MPENYTSTQSLDQCPSHGILRHFNRALTRHRTALIVLAILIGIIVGLAAVVFHELIGLWSYLTTGYTDYPSHTGMFHGRSGYWPLLIIIIPVISGLIYGPIIQKFAPSARGHGVPEVMLAVAKNSGRIPGKVAVVKILGSALTIGGGGSAGREGPVVQVGASLGSWIGSILGLKKEKLILFASCGAAAGISATFNAPLAGAAFAIEIILGSLSAEYFAYIVFSSVSASVISHLLLGNERNVPLHMNLTLDDPRDLIFIIGVAVVAGLAGLFFAKFLYWLEDVMDYFYHWPEWLRPAVGGLFLGVALYFFPIMYGAGASVQLNILNGHYGIAMLLALALGRCLFTSFTIGMGGSGGVFAPSLFIGASVGMAYGLIVAPYSYSSPVVYGVIGMGAAFACSARAPLTAALIIMEMTGQYSLIMPMLLVVGVATGLSLYLTRSTIYTQKLIRRGDSLSDPLARTVLGKRNVASLMRTNVPLASPETTIEEAEQILCETEKTALSIIDEQGRYVGSLTPLTISLALSEGHSPRARIDTLELLTETLRPEDDPGIILDTFAQTPLRSIPVVSRDDVFLGELCGKDILALLAKERREILSRPAPSSFGARMRKRIHEHGWHGPDLSAKK